MEHMLTDCGMTKDAVEEALTAIEMIRGENLAGDGGSQTESNVQGDGT